MARSEPDGSVWGRPEAVDSLGRRPGRSRQVLLALLGASCLAAGAFLGTSASGAPTPERPAGDPDASYNALVNGRTCASVGVVIPADRAPAQGIPENVVVSLYRADPTGDAVLIVPRSHVLTSVQNPDGSLSLSVLVRMGPPGDDQQVADVAGASAAGGLVAAVLYDVNPILVLDECREV